MLRYLIVLSALTTGLDFGVERAAADDTYYMVILATDSAPRRVGGSHTFATVVKLSDRLDADGKRPMESHTISWMPASMKIKLLRGPEPGVNLSLEQTLSWAQSQNLRVTAWGPYQIKKELFDQALAQKERLESGAIAYKALDSRSRCGAVSNCIHAVAGLDLQGGMISTGNAYGEPASRMVAEHLQRWIIQPGMTYPALNESLALAPAGVRFQPLDQAEEVAALPQATASASAVNASPPQTAPAPEASTAKK
jgi:hypothetical protein